MPGVAVPIVVVVVVVVVAAAAAVAAALAVVVELATAAMAAGVFAAINWRLQEEKFRKEGRQYRKTIQFSAQLRS